jgi:hypothetical protein
LSRVCKGAVCSRPRTGAHHSSFSPSFRKSLIVALAEQAFASCTVSVDCIPLRYLPTPSLSPASPHWPFPNTFLPSRLVLPPLLRRRAYRRPSTSTTYSQPSPTFPPPFQRGRQIRTQPGAFFAPPPPPLPQQEPHPYFYTVSKLLSTSFGGVAYAGNRDLIVE